MGVAWIGNLPWQGVWGAVPRSYRLFGAGVLKFCRFDSSYILPSLIKIIPQTQFHIVGPIESGV